MVRIAGGKPTIVTEAEVCKMIIADHLNCGGVYLFINELNILADIVEKIGLGLYDGVEFVCILQEST